MHVKLTNDQPSQFPYTVGQFRRDNPHTSYPKIIPDEILRRNAVFPVEELAKPAYDPLVQTLKRDEMPHKEVIRLKTEKDATDTITGEVNQSEVGRPVYGNKWLVGYVVENKPQDQAETAVRNRRDGFLQETDWIVIKSYERGENIPAVWELYRQALRDITAQASFPYSVEWPIKPE